MTSNPYASSGNDAEPIAKPQKHSFGRIVLAWLCFVLTGLGGSVAVSSALLSATVYVCSSFGMDPEDLKQPLLGLFFACLILATFPGFWLSFRIFGIVKRSQ